VSELAQGLALHLGILEPAEHVLQAFEVGYGCLA
jgi:hypothetical protein